MSSRTTLSDGMHLEADVFQFPVVQNASPVEHEGWLHHLRMEILVWVALELIPLCQDNDGMRTIHRLIWRVRKDQSVLVDLHVVVLELAHGILFLHLRVVYMHDGSIVHQHFGHKYSGGLPHVASVFLECEAEHRDLLVGHCVKEAGDDAISEGLFLVLVHATTDCQYFATSTKPSDSQMYTRFK